MNQNNITQDLPQLVFVETFGQTAIFEAPAEELLNITRVFRNDKNFRFVSMTATDERSSWGGFKVWYIFSVPKEQGFIALFIKLKDTENFPSLSIDFPDTWNYERKINTFFGLTPVGHPDLRPFILHENWPADIFPLRKDFSWNTKPKIANGVYNFQEVGGEGVYEIPVGPIHAGIIEPGHFRFSVAGEEIVQLEPRLGFTHKGVEKLFEVLSMDDKVKLSEKISGDSSFSHSLAFCQALEQLANTKPTERVDYLRVIFSELERLANHLGDIGAIMLDAGFNFGGSHCARLRETVMLVSERLTGNRFLRGLNIPGGITKDIDDQERVRIVRNLENLLKDFSEIVKVAENSASLLNRLKGTGILSRSIAESYGAVGIAAKATGLKRDVRVEFPYAAYDKLILETIEIEVDGDVYARFYVRIKEVRASIRLIIQALQVLPEGALVNEIKKTLPKNTVTVSLVEGWRGEIVYFVTTDSEGKIDRVAPRDPSFVNWSLLGQVSLGNVVPDFPLINKSFNLSYSGNDL
ncbi:hypothetical protein COT94_00825 [Candidatus Falkowbacteria bacterium CG10_big_fil_rev_8_21_14_0_10_37_14]|uniref:NADH-quinone oxidoreductase subunit F n=1 Tax=Candidatus Falkowbacteria bacterium CG10_big_fil_rev_8_21_14_0_10_37_14 TaxID=1974561 RepID=A0A2M6WU92_9BACT|nr:hypothetical protein [Candidatus Falkowbacteria bacterium]PIT96365.1 MAG: hypothetical protein COT94_00825 [Candidatus Falkowbacteria bacterium CG10_big_fil_rev_8_21_14_0_10_37_14]